MGASDYAGHRAPTRETASRWFEGKVNFKLQQAEILTQLELMKAQIH